jgi:hypothetical protein
MIICSRREFVTVRHPLRIRGMERACGAIRVLSVGSFDLAKTQAKDASVADD